MLGTAPKQATDSIDDFVKEQDSKAKPKKGISKKVMSLIMIPVAYLGVQLADYVKSHVTKEPVGIVYAGEVEAADRAFGAVSPDILESRFSDVQGRISIDEYYERSIPRDGLFEGARIGKYKAPVKGTHVGWLKDKWESDYYGDVNDYGEKIRNVLIAKGYGHIVNFLKDKSGEYRSVALFREGYIQFAKNDRAYKIVFEIEPSVVNELTEFTK